MSKHHIMKEYNRGHIKLNTFLTLTPNGDE